MAVHPGGKFGATPHLPKREELARQRKIVPGSNGDNRTAPPCPQPPVATALAAVCPLDGHARRVSFCDVVSGGWRCPPSRPILRRPTRRSGASFFEPPSIVAPPRLPLWAQPTRFSPRSANVSKHRAWASCPPSIIRGARRDSELTRCPRTLTAPLVVPPCRVTTPTSRGGEWTGGLASRRDGGSLKRRPGGLASCAGPST